MYLKMCVWTAVADILFACMPSPDSITYSGFPDDESTNFGQLGGPDSLIKSLSCEKFELKNKR